MSTLKTKTINGILWSAVDGFSVQGITFLVGIVLARLLSPTEFGLIGMITIFIAISESFINSGFSQALIRKKDCTETDYSTVFYFNLAAGVFFFVVLFISAPIISTFFKETQLKGLIRGLSFVLIIDCLTMIQSTTLTKRIDFKMQTKISLIASLASGAIAITMALNGFGVWSLVFKTLSQRGFNSILLWLWNRWRPMLVFSSQSFKELFSFGSKLLLSGLINTAFTNVYYLVIGKYYSAQDLGFYTRAQMFADLPSKNLNSIMSKVTYPVLSQLQDNPEKLKSAYRQMIKSIMFISMILMVGLAAISEPLIITLIGEKWRPAIILLQMLCFVGMMYPLHALNLNMLQVAGRSDLFLKLEIIKKILAVPTIIFGVFYGIKIMIAGLIVINIIAYYINSYWSGRFIGYSIRKQVSDITPSFGLSLLMGLIVFLLGLFLPFKPIGLLITQILTGGAFVFTFCELTQFKDYVFIKKIVLEKIKRNK